MTQIQEQVRQLTPAEIKQHLAVDQYGDFTLTAAIRPWIERQVIPSQAYRIEECCNDDGEAEIPALAASVSREKLFDLFLDLLDELSDTVDVVIESHHERRNGTGGSGEKLREAIDLPVLKSYCFDFEDLLVDDGCFSIAVIDPNGPCEIQFDDHKLLVVYAENLRPFEKIFRAHGIYRDDAIKLINEGEHLHSTLAEYAERFDSLAYTLGID